MAGTEEKKKDRKPESIHSGHRQRMTACFLKNGIDGFSDVQVLEFLLSYSISRIDTNPIAHRLLEEFGDLYHVFNATVPRLMKVPGVAERTASLIRFVGECALRSEQARYLHETYLRTVKEIGQYLVAHIGNYPEERAFVLSLDAKSRVIELKEICRGDVNTVNAPYRKVVEAALLCGATSVVFAHNHVTGPGIPSTEDVEYTKGLANLLRSMKINLVDHIIVSEHTYISMVRGAWL